MANICPIHNIEFSDVDKCSECEAINKQANANNHSQGQETINESPSKDENNFNNEDSSESAQEEKVEIKNEFEFKHPKFKNSSLNIGSSIGEYHNHFYDNLSSNSRTSLRIFSVFEKSDQFDDDNYGDLSPHLTDLTVILKEKRVLILGDAGDREGSKLSYQIAKSLNINDRQNNIKLLQLDELPQENPIKLQSFSFERKSPNENLPEAIVIFDATDATGENTSFTDSLLKQNVSRPSQYPKKLAKNNLYFIFICNSSVIEKAAESNYLIAFPYHLIGSVEKKEESKKTEQTENDFLSQIEQMMRFGDSNENIIVKTVLFVASFYPKLKISDFNQLVRFWLRIEGQTSTGNSVGNISDETKLTQITLEQVWKNKQEFFNEKCNLVFKRNDLNIGIIDFENSNYGAFVKERFESKSFGYVNDKVLDILSASLVLYPFSEVISLQSCRVLSDYSSGYPNEIEDLLINWLLYVFTELENVENKEEKIRNLRNELMQYFGIIDFDKSDKVTRTEKEYFYYNRLAGLFRTMLWDTSLKTTITKAFNKLLHSGCHKSVLELIKRLDDAPNFDESYWLRQLFERGNSSTQEETKAYLFNRLIYLQVEEVFEVLEEWLPKEVSQSNSYSGVNRASLELLLDYYAYQTGKFDKQLYGGNPSEFLLFNYENKDLANEVLDKTIKYLLHPLNETITKEIPHIYYAVFMLEIWWEILYERKNTLEEKTEELEFKNTYLTNYELKESLLERINLYANKSQQEAIIGVLRNQLDVLDLFFDEPSLNWKDRKSISSQRLIIRNLFESYKKSRRLQKSSK